MGPFTEATYDELNRLLKLTETENSHKKLDYDWFLDWVEGDPRTLTRMNTSIVIATFERRDG